MNADKQAMVDRVNRQMLQEWQHELEAEQAWWRSALSSSRPVMPVFVTELDDECG